MGKRVVECECDRCRCDEMVVADKDTKARAICELCQRGEHAAAKERKS